MLIRFKIEQSVGTSNDQCQHHLLVVGNLPSLGAWTPRNAIKLQSSPQGTMSQEIPVSNLQDAKNIQYKFLLVSSSRDGDD